jgi:hypothetical protein
MKKILLITALIFSMSATARNTTKPNYIESENLKTGEKTYSFYYYDSNEDVVRLDKFKDVEVSLPDGTKSVVRVLFYKELVAETNSDYKIRRVWDVVNNITIVDGKIQISTRFECVLSEKIQIGELFKIEGNEKVN